ncbi:lysosomal protective protein precursor [Aspergillus bombycis]|uniref:Lysosomal protective protein n=1 Tax=Aspergillus bombycis TaxID=109264 RepID=A0A1F8AH57_9EURO|nr:lysosomal protective protein precursor [Aspergillus bombycis]OGM51080.1 lysosomal protective protein precursor [Aspergillus bombycis]
MMLLSLGLGVLFGVATAQFPPTPEGVTVIKSKLHENVSISFKEPGICETTPGVRSYSGYVHLPPGFLNHDTGNTQNYPMNTFFWFFEARKDPKNAPLAIWLNGGPGGSSFMGLLEELGPCSVASDSKTTVLNPWSWNNEVNLLFLDQPMQVGFSYDVATNGTLVTDYDAVDSTIVPGDFSTEVPESNFTHRVGTFASQELSQTANSSALAAHALWHFAQTWFFEFPHYKPADDRISLWTESYGGHYGPAIFGLFQEQNDRIAKGTAENGAKYLHLDTLGIVNGLIDAVVQGESYITIGYNNTYGLEIFNQSLHDSLMHEWARPGGCRDRAVACQAALKDWDSTPGKGNISEICKDIDLDCVGGGTARYQQLDRSWYDISHPKNDPFPAHHMLGYLTQESVLKALGVPVNFTEAAPVVHQLFEKTYDITRGGFLDSIAHLLDSGVKVHMMYGDRDYACNWVGGEKASLAVPYSRAAEFASTGYSPLLTSEGVKGMTRQLGNYSFTRVYQAGHEVPAYQPAAAYEIFMRATLDRDIPTGLQYVTEEFRTSGPKDTWHIKNIAPPMPEPRCYVLNPGTCLPEVWERVVAGTATVKDFFVVEDGGNDGVVGWSQDTSQVVLGGM